MKHPPAFFTPSSSVRFLRALQVLAMLSLVGCLASCSSSDKIVDVTLLEADLPQQDLLLWLDADQAGAEEGAKKIKTWADRSGNGNHVEADSTAIKIGSKKVAGRHVLEFTGEEMFIGAPLRPSPGPLTVFIVSTRSDKFASDEAWQRLYSSWDGGTEDDNVWPSFAHSAITGKGGQAYDPVVTEQRDNNRSLGVFAIGGNVKLGGNKFRGQICEILVYGRKFTTETEYSAVRDYLSRKWGATIAANRNGWTRRGILENPPERSNEQFPLSDQSNEEGWTMVAELSDEFEGDQLDEDKWFKVNPDWLGQAPAFFSTNNVSVSNGVLNLTFRQDKRPEWLEDEKFDGYSAASVMNRKRAQYGYFEVRAKPIDFAVKSKWVMHTGYEDDTASSIDIFELQGKQSGKRNQLQMASRMFKAPGLEKGIHQKGVWYAPFPLNEDFHVYGLKWTSDEITYFLDGVEVRRVENKHHHLDTRIAFHCMPISPEKLPQDEQLPTAFQIDYIRSWQKSGMSVRQWK